DVAVFGDPDIRTIVTAPAVAVGENGEVLVAGQSQGEAMDFGGGTDVLGPYAARFGASLELRAIQGMQTDTLGLGAALSIAAGPDHQIAIAGNFLGAADFGGGPVESGIDPASHGPEDEFPGTDGFVAVYRALSAVDRQ
ncbi:MAG TPA: hypothetical protein VKB80_23910, partial [Kofleriaceae bacterium]|nr:hypothetical protein [Kofleriaceae bacterium]